jgi:5-methylcytosine-specific restriction endonuclease McrA
MLTCTICHFETVLDDVVISRADGLCVCLPCFGRETGSARPMSKTLRRELSAALAGL